MKKKSNRFIIMLITFAVINISACSSSKTASPSSSVTNNSSIIDTDISNQVETAQKWINANYKKGADITNSDAEKIKSKVTEDAFLTAWKNQLLDDLSKTSGFPPAVKHFVDPAIKAYEKVWGGTDKIKTVVDAMSNMSEAYDTYTNINDAYDFSMYTYPEVYDDILYVIQRVDGVDLSDTIDSLLNQAAGNGATGSYWACTNVVYQYGVAVPGDDYYLIHTNIQNPFRQQGPCSLSCVFLDTSYTLTDANGFNHDAPIFELVDGVQYRADLEKFKTSKEKTDMNYAIITDFLSGNIKSTADTSSNDVSSEKNAAKISTGVDGRAWIGTYWSEDDECIVIKSVTSSGIIADTMLLNESGIGGRSIANNLELNFLDGSTNKVGFNDSGAVTIFDGMLQLQRHRDGFTETFTKSSNDTNELAEYGNEDASYSYNTSSNSSNYDLSKGRVITIDGNGLVADDIINWFNSEVTVYEGDYSDYVYDENQGIMVLPIYFLEGDYPSETILLADWLYVKTGSIWGAELSSIVNSTYNTYDFVQYPTDTSERDKFGRIYVNYYTLKEKGSGNLQGTEATFYPDGQYIVSGVHNLLRAMKGSLK